MSIITLLTFVVQMAEPIKGQEEARPNLTSTLERCPRGNLVEPDIVQQASDDVAVAQHALTSSGIIKRIAYCPRVRHFGHLGTDLAAEFNGESFATRWAVVKSWAVDMLFPGRL